jgi:ubiquinone/menaquinone biosynthesis C-methylase UbiE
VSQVERVYLPAAGLDVLLPLYDPMVRLLGADGARRKLFEQAGALPQHHLLDIGCGTGTLAVAIKGWLPGAQVAGLDPDPRALARARRKARNAGVAIAFVQGFADDLPYPEASFDRVFSSLMFHHLPFGTKLPALREVRRVLKPGGSLHLLDFEQEGPHSHNPLAHWLHSSKHMQGNQSEQILGWMREAGFADARLVARQQRIFGKIAYLAAQSGS